MIKPAKSLAHSLGPHPLLGVILSIAVACLLGMGAVFAKQSYEYGTGVLFVVLMRGMVPVAVFFLFSKISRIPLNLKKIPKKAVVLVGVSLSITAFSYMSALIYISPNLAVILLFLFPIFVLIGASIRDKKPPSLTMILAYLAAFAGLVIVMGGGVEQLDIRGIALAVTASISAASLFFVAHITGPEVKSQSLIFIGSLILTLAALFANLLHGFSPPQHFLGWQAIVIASLCYTLGIVLVITATHSLRPDLSSLIMNIEPFIVLMMAWFILGDTLTLLQIAGMFIVISAVSLGGVLAHRRSLKETQNSVVLEHFD